MLCLSRLPGQSLYIGEDIKIIVLEIRDGRKVRIGIDAPEDVRIYREEVLNRIKRDERKREHDE